MNLTAPSPDKLHADAGMTAAIASIRKRLDVLSVTALDDDDVQALAVMDEWLADIAYAHEQAASDA